MKREFEFEPRYSDVEQDLQDRENRIKAIRYKVCSKCGEKKPVSKFTTENITGSMSELLNNVRRITKWGN